MFVHRTMKSLVSSTSVVTSNHISTSKVVLTRAAWSESALLGKVLTRVSTRLEISDDLIVLILHDLASHQRTKKAI